MNILITGGTGFIGQYLCRMLLRQGHYLQIVTRTPDKYQDGPSKNKQFISWDSDLTSAVKWADAVINLAGENIFGQRWTEGVKKEIYSSRIQSTKSLIKAIAQANNPPKVMISGSAVGYYGHHGSQPIDEETAASTDFLAKLCVDWEKQAQQVKEYGVRLVIMRTGIVLGSQGGMLKQMVPPFKLFVGGSLGRGTQYIPWIHRKDICRACNYFLTHGETTGPYNMSAPNPVTMDQFTHTLGEVLNRPSLFRVPEWALKLVLGEAAEPALASIRAQPTRLQQAGFDFKYSHLREALAEIL